MCVHCSNKRKSVRELSSKAMRLNLLRQHNNLHGLSKPRRSKNKTEPIFPPAVRSFRSGTGVVLRAGDVLIVFLTLFSLLHIMQRASFDSFYLAAALIGTSLFAFFGSLLRIYPAGHDMSFDFSMGKVLQAWVLTAAGLVFVGFATKTTEIYSRLTIGIWFAIVPAGLIIWRLLHFGFMCRLQRKRNKIGKTAIAGAGKLGTHLTNLIEERVLPGMHVSAFYDDHKPKGHRPLPDRDTSVQGTLDDLCDLAKRGEIDCVYVTLPMRAEERIKEIVSRLGEACTKVYVVPDIFLFDLLQSHWISMCGIPLVSIYDSPHDGVQSWAKVVTDYALASIILVFISMPMLLIAAGVKLSSPGPVLFKQRRYGIDGREVVVWKFRTMTVCEDGAVVPQTCKNDSRVTRFGRMLRRTSLDELPQFINVLQGRMSVVGPRPHAVAHNEEYRHLIRGYMLRHKVKPGITGWAQVNGWRGETEELYQMERRIEHDMQYIRNWSVWLDIKIVLLTLFKGFWCEKAY